MKDKAKEYFEVHPNRQEVIVTPDGQVYHTEDSAVAHNHVKNAGLSGPPERFSRQDVEKKKSKKKSS